VEKSQKRLYWYIFTLDFLVEKMCVLWKIGLLVLLTLFSLIVDFSRLIFHNVFKPIFYGKQSKIL